MASHVPFLAIRPDDQFSAEVKTRDFASTNGVFTPLSSSPATASSTSNMDSTRRPGASVGAMRSIVPKFARFPVAVLISMGLNTLLYTITASWAGPELAAIKRPLTEDWQVASLVAWRVAQLGAAWFVGLDYLDVACLTLMCNLPYYYLLRTFFEVSELACASALAIDVGAMTVPFALLKPLYPSHQYSSSGSAKAPIDQDKNIRFFMTALATAVYTVVTYASFYTWLPTYMIVHFDGLKSLASAHESALWTIGVVMVPMGMAATDFLFTPAASEQRGPPASAVIKFDAKAASLGETLAYNLGFGPVGFGRKADVLFKRTAIVVACQFANSVVRTYGTVEGTELWGALAWAGVWSISTAVVGIVYGWASNE